MSCLSNSILVTFAFGLAANLIIAIMAIVKIGFILTSALDKLKAKMETSLELKNIFEVKYFSKDMMWEQRALFHLLTSNKLDKFCVFSRKKIFFYSLLSLTPLVWFGLFYFLQCYF